jgi:hypothetical protein
LLGLLRWVIEARWVIWLEGDGRVAAHFGEEGRCKA